MATIVQFTHQRLFSESEPALRPLVRRISDAMSISFEKAVASLHQPKDYPLPSAPSAAERIWADFLSSLPKRKQKEAVELFFDRVQTSGTARKQMYGLLAQVNLRSAVPISDQVRRIAIPKPNKPSAKFIGSLGKRLESAIECKRVRAEKRGVPHLNSPSPKLEMRLVSMTCGKDTPELGKDEMFINGVSSDGIGQLRTIPDFNLGKYKSGASKVFNPPEVFHVFPLAQDFLFDREFSIDLLLLEKDWFLIAKEKKEAGGIGQVVGSLIDSVASNAELKQTVEELIKAASAGGLAALMAELGIGVATGGATFASLVAAIQGALVPILVGAALVMAASIIKRLVQHEIYSKSRAAITIAPLTEPILEPIVLEQHFIEYSDYRSQYVLTYDWRLIP